MYEPLIDVAAARNLLVFDVKATPGQLTPRLLSLISSTLVNPATDIFVADIGYFSLLGLNGLESKTPIIKYRDKEIKIHLDNDWDDVVGFYHKKLRDLNITPMHGDECFCFAVSVPDGLTIEQMSEKAYEFKHHIVLGSF